ncbi:MAG: hypothetical protein M3N54_04955, partial [Acidobacteriota bacterium]|nr:hypothetical protein [Acidobacteriota bacterium]
ILAIPARSRNSQGSGTVYAHSLETPKQRNVAVGMRRRMQDRVLVAGDAFVTTKQESLLAVATQRSARRQRPQATAGHWPEPMSRTHWTRSPGSSTTWRGPAMAVM